MNRKKDVIEIVKKLLFSKDEEIKMEAQAKLVDGTIVMTPDSEFKPGVELFIITEDGNNEPAPDGTHELEDGTFVKTEGGFVVSVERNEGDDVAETEMKDVKSGDDVLEIKNTAEAIMAEHEKLIMKLTEIEEKMTALEQKFEEVAGEITSSDAIVEEFSKVKEATKIMFEEFANQPEGRVLDTTKASFEGEFSNVRKNTNSKSEKIKDLINYMRK